MHSINLLVFDPTESKMLTRVNKNQIIKATGVKEIINTFAIAKEVKQHQVRNGELSFPLSTLVAPGCYHLARRAARGSLAYIE